MVIKGMHDYHDSDQRQSQIDLSSYQFPLHLQHSKYTFTKLSQIQASTSSR